MSTERPTQSDRELWRSLAGSGDVASGTTSGPVADLDFAAWLEGRLPEAAAARVEAAVAADPEMRRAALELAEMLGQQLPPAPARLEVRAKALVGFEAERRTRSAGLFDWLLAGGKRFAVQRAVALTAALVIAVSGFMLGGGLGETMAQERYASVTKIMADGSSNELTEFLVKDGI